MGSPIGNLWPLTVLALGLLMCVVLGATRLAWNHVYFLAGAGGFAANLALQLPDAGPGLCVGSVVMPILYIGAAMVGVALRPALVWGGLISEAAEVPGPVCGGCGYSLVGLPHPTCPECGRAISREEWKAGQMAVQETKDSLVTNLFDARVKAAVAEQPYPLVFATISGAHLYGFPSPDSDYDLRGVHVLPLLEVIGLEARRETIEVSADREGLEIDLVTHDAEKYFRLVLKRNGYVLEQIFSPLVLHTTPEHEELKAIARECITRNHGHHYLGFGETQWKLFRKEDPPRVKPLLYVYRGVLTGIHLMKTGEVEANLVRLNEAFKLPYIGELVARKMEGAEKSRLSGADVAFHEGEYRRLVGMLEEAMKESRLREEPAGRKALNDLLVQLRKRW